MSTFFVLNFTHVQNMCIQMHNKHGRCPQLLMLRKCMKFKCNRKNDNIPRTVNGQSAYGIFVKVHVRMVNFVRYPEILIIYIDSSV